MSNLLTSRFMPFLFVGVVCALNGIAIKLMPPPGDPSEISFRSAEIQAREGEEVQLVIRISPPSPRKLMIGLLHTNQADAAAVPLWKFNEKNPQLTPQGNDWVIEIPGGHDEVVIRGKIQDDHEERDAPGRFAFNLKHLGSHTRSGKFRSVELRVRDPYVHPVVAFGTEEAVPILEGEIKKIPLLVTGSVEKNLSIPVTIVGDTPADLLIVGKGVVRINAGAKFGQFNLKAIKDTLYEGDEGAVIQLLSDGDEFVVGENAELQVTVVDSDQKPQFTIKMPKLVVQHNEDARVQLHASVAADETQQVEVAVAVLSDVPEEILDLLPKRIRFVMPAGKIMVEQMAFDASVPWPRGYHQMEFVVEHSRQLITVAHAPVALSVEASTREESDSSPIDVFVKLPPETSAISDNEILLQGSGTATLGEDYTVLGGKPSRAGDTWNLRLVIPEGQQTARLAIRLRDDRVHEGDEEIRLELVEASTGLDENRSANVLIRDDEKQPRLKLVEREEKLFEGDEIEIEIQIPEGQPESSRPIQGTLRVDRNSSAESGKHYEIEDAKFKIPPRKRSATIKLRVKDDQKADRGPPKLLNLSLGDVKNATADKSPLRLSIHDNDTWLGERLVLIAWTEDLDTTKELRDAIDAFQKSLTQGQKDKLVGGDIQCVDASLRPSMPMDEFLKAKTKSPFNNLNTAKILGRAEALEEQITKLRPPGPKFETILIYPIGSGSNRRTAPFGLQKPALGHKRFVWIIGRDEDEVGSHLRADAEIFAPEQAGKRTWSTVDEWEIPGEMAEQYKRL